VQLLPSNDETFRIVPSFYFKTSGLWMSRTAQAAKRALVNFCAESMSDLASACLKDAKDVSVDTVLSPVALASFFRGVEGRLSGPRTTRDVEAISALMRPLLQHLARSGIQNSDRFNHQIDDFLKSLRKLLS
jgi:hypothetical protein